MLGSSCLYNLRNPKAAIGFPLKYDPLSAQRFSPLQPIILPPKVDHLISMIGTSPKKYMCDKGTEDEKQGLRLFNTYKSFQCLEIYTYI